MAICKCSPEYTYQPHSDRLHQLQSPHKCLVDGCNCQEFQDCGQKWTDTFVTKSREKDQF